MLVYNSAGVVAKCPDYTRVYLVPYNGAQTAIVPLVYDNNKSFNGTDFSDSGNFIVTFTVYPEAGQMITVTVENNALTSFSNGNAFIDVSNVPPVPRNCLTVTNLPWNFQERNITDVFVWNQTGKVAKCQGYNLLEIIRTDNTSTVLIPLVYNNDEKALFAETGPFYVTFDLNVDALTRIAVTAAENILVTFSGGKGTLDASTLPQTLPVPYFTITGLPKNTVKGNFSEVFLYNAVGKIAKCADYQGILISRNSQSASAMIPLVYNESPNGPEYFRDSGQFAVTFSINVDINTQIIKTRADSQVVEFTDGSGDLDLGFDLGYFMGELTNPHDASAPILKAGTIFEMNGGYINLTANTAVPPAVFPATCVIYVYAIKDSGNVSFMYSATAPLWNATKKGYYLGNQRAIYKMVYLKDTTIKYVAKTIMADDWKTFASYEVSNAGLSNGSQIYSLSGSDNPAAQALQITEGWHIVVLRGAGGGGGGGINGYDSRNFFGGNGGAGGAITELVYFKNHQMTLFTGSGGSGASHISYGRYQGTGGGGGGAGAFMYTPDGYFACAGGGGGGGGVTTIEGSLGGGGAGGGAGGSAGSGGGGGSGGPYNQYYGSKGGNGGGLAGGSGGPQGTITMTQTPGGNGTIVTGYIYSPGGDGSNGAYYGPALSEWGYKGLGIKTYNNNPLPAPGSHGGAAGFNHSGDFKNTAGSNGQGGNAGIVTHGTAGGAGGNNHNSTRGGGGGGGAGGNPDDSTNSAGKTGGSGSITVYKVL